MKDTRLVPASQAPFPFRSRGKYIENQGKELSRVLGMVWRRETQPSLVPQNRNREVHVVYNVEKNGIPPKHGRFVRVCTGGERIGTQISTVTAELPGDRICRLPVEVRTAVYPFTRSEAQIFVDNRTEQEICIPKQCEGGINYHPQ